MSQTRRQHSPRLQAQAAANGGMAEAASASEPARGLAGWPAMAWRRIRDFSAFGGDATYLWPRWLVLRAVGLVFIFVFAGIIREGQALVGPGGIAPLTGFFAQLTKTFPNPLEAFWRAPSLLWLGHGAGAISALAWGGLAAAVALTANVWPRLALFGCWAALLSFVTTWQIFSATQVDQIMLETALLLIPLAPAGWRPGLGAESPPGALAVFMARWLLVRVMLESGVMKLLVGDHHWFDLSAMDVLYETAPFPTLLGYWDHQLPHAWHAAEAMLTFAAEIVAPVLAVWGGRRGRWIALVTWTIFQAGIQLTNNFGWLNIAALALGLLLLDDQMLAGAAGKLRWKKWFALPVARAAIAPAPAAWRRHALAAALWLHFGLAAVFFVAVARPPQEGGRLAAALGRLQMLAGSWHSANAYTLYAALLPGRFAVEFAGSNDGGLTWRAWAFRHQPQREDHGGEFLAPWYARFEATLQVQANAAEPSPLFAVVAAHLLAHSPEVLALFRGNPFPDAPPGLVRIRGYRLAFTDAATWRKTGKFWRREETGDHRPMMFREEDGRILVADTPAEEQRAQAIHGHAEAQFFLGLSHLNREGAGQDGAAAARWFRRAAEQGHLLAQHNLAVILLRGTGVARDETEALVWFGVAALGGEARAARNRDLVAAQLGPVRAAAAAQRSKIVFAEIAARKAHD